MHKVRIGIVGCGAIGSSLAQAILSDFSERARLVALFDIDSRKARKLCRRLKHRPAVASTLGTLIRQSDFVVEAAGASCASGIAQRVISAAKDIMIMSVGGVLRDYPRLCELAKKKGSRIFIPSGAISGIDGLRAAGCGTIKKVILTTRKPVVAFRGVPYVMRKKLSLEGITSDKIIFEGSALEAIKYFPQNINVAATLSIAGIGPRRTRVRIVASPKINRNIHEVRIESTAGVIVSRTENVIHPSNPKTSYLAVLSALATLKGMLDSVNVGT